VAQGVGSDTALVVSEARKNSVRGAVQIAGDVASRWVRPPSDSHPCATSEGPYWSTSRWTAGASVGLVQVALGWHRWWVEPWSNPGVGTTEGNLLDLAPLGARWNQQFTFRY